MKQLITLTTGLLAVMVPEGAKRIRKTISIEHCCYAYSYLLNGKKEFIILKGISMIDNNVSVIGWSDEIGEDVAKTLGFGLGKSGRYTQALSDLLASNGITERCLIIKSEK